MLAFHHRFHGHGSLRYVYKNGTALRSHLLTVKYTYNKHRKYSRFSVVVSKKVHKGAVGRNRIRRRIYEVIREDLPEMKQAYDIALIVFSNELMTMPYAELKEAIHQLFSQGDLYKKP